jgi:hypothetical protein
MVKGQKNLLPLGSNLGAEGHARCALPMRYSSVFGTYRAKFCLMSYIHVHLLLIVPVFPSAEPRP